MTPEDDYLRRLFERFYTEMRKRRQPQPSIPEPEQPEGYFEADLTIDERAFLLALARNHASNATAGIRKRTLEALELARYMPLPRAEWLDWAELEAEAERQGCDVVDVWFDRISKREAA